MANTTVSLRLTDEDLEIIADLGKRLGMDRTQVIRYSLRRQLQRENERDASAS